MMVSKARAQAHIGVGLYSLSDAARIIREPLSTVRRWAEPAEKLIPRTLNLEEKTLTFVELMELHFISMFRNEGVSLQTIKETSIAASRRFNTTCPFAVKRFDTDGRTIFATLLDEHKDKTLVEDLKKGQFVFEQIMKPFFRKLEYHGLMEVVRYWPNEKSGRVVLDPKRQFGRPIDFETGIPTRTVFDAVRADANKSHREIAEWFGIAQAAVDAAVDFENSLRS